METLVWVGVGLAALFVLAGYAGARVNAARQEDAGRFVEAIEAEKRALLSGPNPQIPDLDPAAYGYRPVRGEQLLAVQEGVAQMEMRSTGRYVNAGPVISVPIAKGLRFRVAAGQYASQKTLQPTAHGRLLVTDKAVVFESPTRNERFTWGTVADIEIAVDGFGVAKRSGPRRIYRVPAPDPRFAAIVELMLDLVQAE